MPLFVTRATNSVVHAFDDGVEHDDAEAALAEGVRSAIALAADEMAHGKTSAAVEVSIEKKDGTRLLRSVVSVCVSPLMLGQQAA